MLTVSLWSFFKITLQSISRKGQNWHWLNLFPILTFKMSKKIPRAVKINLLRLVIFFAFKKLNYTFSGIESNLSSTSSWFILFLSSQKQAQEQAHWVGATPLISLKMSA